MNRWPTLVVKRSQSSCRCVYTAVRLNPQQLHVGEMYRCTVRGDVKIRPCSRRAHDRHDRCVISSLAVRYCSTTLKTLFLTPSPPAFLHKLGRVHLVKHWFECSASSLLIRTCGAENVAEIRHEVTGNTLFVLAGTRGKLVSV